MRWPFTAGSRPVFRRQPFSRSRLFRHWSQRYIHPSSQFDDAALRAILTRFEPREFQPLPRVLRHPVEPVPDQLGWGTKYAARGGICSHSFWHQRYSFLRESCDRHAESSLQPGSVPARSCTFGTLASPSVSSSCQQTTIILSALSSSAKGSAPLQAIPRRTNVTATVRPILCC
jgi:hypothetical protein